MKENKEIYKKREFIDEFFGEIGVRIDIWTHFMRECIIELCTLH